MSRYTRVYNSHRWRKIRSHFAAQLPLPCWRCGELIMPGERWDLGHRVDAARGGALGDAWPEHARCNRSAGQALGQELRSAQRASRDW